MMHPAILRFSWILDTGDFYRFLPLQMCRIIGSPSLTACARGARLWPRPEIVRLLCFASICFAWMLFRDKWSLWKIEESSDFLWFSHSRLLHAMNIFFDLGFLWCSDSRVNATSLPAWVDLGLECLFENSLQKAIGHEATYHAILSVWLALLPGGSKTDPGRVKHLAGLTGWRVPGWCVSNMFGRASYISPTIWHIVVHRVNRPEIIHVWQAPPKYS